MITSMPLILVIIIAISFSKKSAAYNLLAKFLYELKDGFNDFLIFLSYYRKAKFLFKRLKSLLDFKKLKNVLLLIIIAATFFYLFLINKRKDKSHKP